LMPGLSIISPHRRVGTNSPRGDPFRAHAEMKRSAAIQFAFASARSTT
jgi:hypothetical protein